MPQELRSSRLQLIANVALGGRSDVVSQNPVFKELWINLTLRGVQEIVNIHRAAMRLLPIVAIYCVPLFAHPPGSPTDSSEVAVYKSFVKQHTAWAGGCESAVLDSGALPIAEGFSRTRSRENALNRRKN